MRYILTLVLIFSTIFAQDKKETITLGFGPYIQTQPYEGVDNILLPSPVIFYDNSLFYIRWSRAGIYFLGSVQDAYSWGFSLSVQPRTYGYKKGEIAGMDERKTTWEGGVAFSAKKDNSYIEIMALTDIFARYDSWILKTEVGYDFEFDKLKLYPSLIFIYQSQDFMNYYYGVTAKEAQKSTLYEYIPNAGIQLGIQTYIKYPFSKQLSALINLRADKTPTEVTSSPIVTEDYIYSGLASLIYTFTY